jgi:hypothetical protein
MRVQIPVYTDRWMRGDRYGELVKVTSYRKGRRKTDYAKLVEIAHVKLDKSGQTLCFMLDDCTEVA